MLELAAAAEIKVNDSANDGRAAFTIRIPWSRAYPRSDEEAEKGQYRGMFPFTVVRPEKRSHETRLGPEIY